MQQETPTPPDAPTLAAGPTPATIDAYDVQEILRALEHYAAVVNRQTKGIVPAPTGASQMLARWCDVMGRLDIDRYGANDVRVRLSAAPPVTPPPAPGEAGDSKHWVEDIDGDDGYYEKDCTVCGRRFMGARGRSNCKVCSAPPAGRGGLPPRPERTEPTNRPKPYA
jgi:hypothetical protein